jgi:hypothetical protein
MNNIAGSAVRGRPALSFFDNSSLSNCPPTAAVRPLRAARASSAGAVSLNKCKTTPENGTRVRSNRKTHLDLQGAHANPSRSFDLKKRVSRLEAAFQITQNSNAKNAKTLDPTAPTRPERKMDPVEGLPTSDFTNPEP